LHMQPNALIRREYKGKIYIKNIRKNLCRNRLKNGIRSGSEKMIPDPQHCTSHLVKRNEHSHQKLFMLRLYLSVFPLIRYFKRRPKASKASHNKIRKILIINVMPILAYRWFVKDIETLKPVRHLQQILPNFLYYL
jgi:hypothetical protein